MPTIDEIVEGLNQILCRIADSGCLLDEEIEEWSNLMCSYRILQNMEMARKSHTWANTCQRFDNDEE